MPFNRTMRASGAPCGVTVASVIALTSGSFAASASLNQRSNCASGSASASASRSPARMYSWRMPARCASMLIVGRFYNGRVDSPGVFDYGHGIFAVDSVYDRRLQTAIHLVVEEERAAVIDTGTSHAVPRVLEALAA